MLSQGTYINKQYRGFGCFSSIYSQSKYNKLANTLRGYTIKTSYRAGLDYRLDQNPKVISNLLYKLYINKNKTISSRVYKYFKFNNKSII